MSIELLLLQQQKTWLTPRVYTMQIDTTCSIGTDCSVGGNITVVGNIIGHIQNLDAGLPIAAIDGNGITYNGGALHMEQADATHPGILDPSLIVQTIGGSKAFNGYISVDQMRSNNNPNIEFVPPVTFDVGMTANTTSPGPGVNITEQSGGGSSKRAQMNIGTNYMLLQDTGNNGNLDFGIDNVSASGLSFLIDPTGYVSFPMGQMTQAVQINEDTVLNESHYNKTIELITSGSAAYNVTLPAVGSQATYKFRFVITNNTPAHNITISTVSGIAGYVLQNAGVVSVSGSTITYTQAIGSNGCFCEVEASDAGYSIKAWSPVSSVWTVA